MINKTTVADFIATSDLITKQINESTKLVIELKKELEFCRTTLEHLVIFAPNKDFKSVQPYHLRENDSDFEKKAPMIQIIEKQATRINYLLGDKR
jgi:hypothetical protein